MWRLLPALVLASCAAQQPSDTVDEQRTADSSRLIDARNLPLAPAAGAGQPAAKAFRQGNTRGSVEESGAWTISTSVTHTRLRCATYETGIQLGQGSASCSDVRWLSPEQYGTRQTQCNSATLMHRGGGELPITPDTFNAANCVRVLTRCTGPC